MNEDEATRLFSKAAESLPNATLPPATQLIQQGKRAQRRQRLLSAGSVAAVAALIIGAGVLWLPGSTGSAQPPTNNETTAPDDSGLPPAPDGTRWVGLNGVMVAAPESWRVQFTACGSATSDAVDFHSDFVECPSPAPGTVDGASFSVLRPLALSSPLGKQRQKAGGESVDLGGVRAYRTGGCEFLCSGALVVPQRDVVFEVGAEDIEVVDGVLDTARLVPEGYTAVPDVTGLGSGSPVRERMEAAQLEWESCFDGALCSGEVPVEATDPAPGSVVPVGTKVSHSGSEPPDEATSDLPAPPDGTRWVGFNGVMAAVPQSWSVNDTRCGRPLSDTVDFDDQTTDRCNPAVSNSFTAVRVVALSSPFGEQWQGVDGQQVDVNGSRAVRVGGQGCRLSDPPQCSGLLAIPGRDAVLVVESRRSAEEVNAILDTARLVPEGYTAVPDVAGLGSDSAARARMEAAQLEWATACDDETACLDELLPFEATDPTAGSVVPVGTTVRAVYEAPEQVSAVEVPNVLGLTDEWAKRLLDAEGFTSYRFVYQHNEDVPPGTVFEVTPRPGAYVRTDDLLRVIIAGDDSPDYVAPEAPYVAVIAAEGLRAHLTALFDYHDSAVEEIWVNESICAREPVASRDNGCRLWTAAEQEELRERLASLGAVSFVPSRAGLEPPARVAYAGVAQVVKQSDNAFSVHVFAHDGNHAYWGDQPDNERPCGWQVWTLAPNGGDWTASLNTPVRTC